MKIMLASNQNLDYVATLQTDESTSLEVVDFASDSAIEVEASSCFGSFGTFGSAGGCFGTFGTYGCG
jgi:hypothetical protein